MNTTALRRIKLFSILILAQSPLPYLAVTTQGGFFDTLASVSGADNLTTVWNDFLGSARAQSSDEATSLLLYDGETVLGSPSYAEDGAGEGVDSSAALRLNPDYWHAPRLRLVDDAWRSDFRQYRYLQFAFRSPEADPGEPKLFLKAWPGLVSKVIAIGDYIEGGVIDNTWRTVSIPIIQMATEDWMLDGVEDVQWIADANKHYFVDDAQLVGIGDPWAYIDVHVVDVHAAAPDVITVVIESVKLGETDAASLPIDSTQWLVDGAQAQNIYRYSIPWDEGSTIDNADKHLVTVRHRVYLQLDQPLKAGHTYAVQTPYGKTTLAFAEQNTFCEAIKVNQVGYSEGATSRYANYGVYLGDGGSRQFGTLPTYDVIRLSDGQTVASGTAVYMGDDTIVSDTVVSSGEHVYRLSLNAVPAGGPYSVVVNGCGRSRPFGIGDAYTQQIAYVLTRGLYHQRHIELESAYTAFTRGPDHHTTVYDTRAVWGPSAWITPTGNEPTIAITGGYHDAGDFDTRPFHTIIPIRMLAYYEAFPDHFIDGQYNIPESGNGIPDFLDEAIWGMRVWENLQVSDPKDPDYGGVRQGFEAAGHPGYGYDSAASETQLYGTFDVAEGTTAQSAGMFALASRLIAPYDSTYATQLLNKAALAWNWLEANGDVNALTGNNLSASLQLYLATGESQYHEIFKTAANAILINRTTAWPQQFVASNSSAGAPLVYFSSYLITDQPTDATVKSGIIGRVFSAADGVTYMGGPPELETYPKGVTKYMAWGASTAQGRYAEIYVFAYRLSTDPVKQQQYYNYVSQYTDFTMGLNPIGMSFTTGLGVDAPVSPLHLDSWYTKYGKSDGVTTDHVGKPIGNVPGIVIYGATQGETNRSSALAVTDKLYPDHDALPQLRRWADGWSSIAKNEFTTHETQVWNVAMLGFLYDADPADANPADTDKDGYFDAFDNCPATPYTDQRDLDGDGVGNVCDSTPNGDSAPKPPANLRQIKAASP